jgi:chemotaxis protein MotB
MIPFKRRGFRLKTESSIDEDDFFISWGDLVTLLLVFFIYLFSISEINIVDFLKATKSIKTDIGLSMDETLINQIELEHKKLKEMKIEIDDYIKKTKTEEVLSVSYDKDHLELNLGDSILFTSGSNHLKKEGQNVLNQLAKLFKTTNCNIIIEGYTDNSPIRTLRFSSNWELSAARAAAVVQCLENRSISGARFKIIGYGEHSALVPNTSLKNKAKNRRVKIILRPQINISEKKYVDPLQGIKTNSAF